MNRAPDSPPAKLGDFLLAWQSDEAEIPQDLGAIRSALNQIASLAHEAHGDKAAKAPPR